MISLSMRKPASKHLEKQEVVIGYSGARKADVRFWQCEVGAPQRGTVSTFSPAPVRRVNL